VCESFEISIKVFDREIRQQTLTYKTDLELQHRSVSMSVNLARVNEVDTVSIADPADLLATSAGAASTFLEFAGRNWTCVTQVGNLVISYVSMPTSMAKSITISRWKPQDQTGPKP
jgi:hypothetical protein